MKASKLMVVMLYALSSAAMAAEPAGADRTAQPANEAERSAPRASEPAQSTAPRTAESAAPAARASRTGARADRLDLDTTVVTGNRELPKVLYIVPWKKADIGDLPGQPFNTLLDEALAPVDRDVFRREVTYYGAISGEPAGIGTSPAAPPRATGGSEK